MMNPFSTSFRTFDSTDYSPISTIDVGRKIWDLATDYDDSYIAVAEYHNNKNAGFENIDDPEEGVCRLYEIGRRRPHDSDRYLLI